MKTIAFLVAVLFLVGCRAGKDPHAGLDPTLDGFFPEDAGESRKPGQFADAQAAAGARSDGMLGRQHFDGAGALNSLGEAKLALMLRDDDPCSPMRVFLTADEADGRAEARRNAVTTFLRDKGLAPTQIEVVVGDNPASRSRASDHLSRLHKLETGKGGEGGDDAGDAEAGGGAGDAAGGVGAAGAAGLGSAFK